MNGQTRPVNQIMDRDREEGGDERERGALFPYD
jgi:hypothetical protein